MDFKKIFDLISNYKNEIDRLEDCRIEANSYGNYDEAEYFAGAINSFERVVIDLENSIVEQMDSLEMMVREHQVEQVLSNYSPIGV